MDELIETIEPKKRGRPKKLLPDVPERADVPRISILERRIQNPFGEPSQSVRFKDNRLTARWFNDAARSGQIFRAKELGWNDVTQDMIQDMNSLGNHELNPAGQIVRGERGQEVLMWMPTKDFKEIQMAKDRKNRQLMGDPVAQKNEIVAAAGLQLGDQAASFLNDEVQMHVSVKDRVQRESFQEAEEGMRPAGGGEL